MEALEIEEGPAPAPSDGASRPVTPSCRAQSRTVLAEIHAVSVGGRVTRGVTHGRSSAGCYSLPLLRSNSGAMSTSRSQGSESWRDLLMGPVGEVPVFLLFVLPLLLRTALDVLVETSLLSRTVRFMSNQVMILSHLAYHCIRINLQKEKHIFDPLLLVLLAYTYFVATFPKPDNHGENTPFLLLASTCLSLFYLWRFYTVWSTLRGFSKHIVSKKKRRFIDQRQGLDLDLSYIFPQIIAMGFPTEELLEQQYRNPMDQVQKFFSVRHRGHYKVYNLCSERTYSRKSFEREYHDVRFPDHNPCRLADLHILCQDMEDFLRQDRVSNVVAVHCKAGKGRTGLVVSSFLLHVQKCFSADEALALFAQQRTYDGKGVTIPSQIRYVHHYEAVVREGKVRAPRWLRLTRVEVCPKLMERWDFQILTHEDGVIFDTTQRDTLLPLLHSDVKVVFFQGSQKLFHLWMHTSYDAHLHQRPAGAVDSEDATAVWAEGAPAERLYAASFERRQLDGPHKKKKKTGKPDKVGELKTVRLFFAKPSSAEVQAAQLEKERQDAQHRREEISVLHMQELEAERVRKQEGEAAEKQGLVEDYDDLEYDTDHDEILDTLCSGYLLRSAGSCSRPTQRLCKLSTSGRLHILGGSYCFGTLGTLAVDISEDADNVLQDAYDPDEPPSAWRVRNPQTRCWELLEATDPSEASRWEQGLADAVRLGRAAKDSLTAFAGFFWKLNSNVDTQQIPRSFECADWRIRLFVLRVDGNMLVYSHKTRSEEVFCNFCTAGCVMTDLPQRWRGMEHIVLFQVTSQGSDKPPRTLAARHEDFEAFAMRVSALKQHGSAPRAGWGNPFF